MDNGVYSLEAFLKKISLPVILFWAVIVFGSAAYYLLWRSFDATVMDALFMTFITVTTVGYSEVYPLTTFGRIITIFVSLMGIASLFYLFTEVMAYLVARRLSDPFGRRRMKQQIKELNDHIIVTGFGHFGQHIAQQLELEGTEFVIIESDAVVQAQGLERGYLLIEGDAEEDEVLLLAGVTRARALIAATSNDAINAFIVMSARALNKDLLIVAKADEDADIRKLKKAGANDTINPYSIAGQRLVNRVLRPGVVDFMQATIVNRHSDLNVREFMIPVSSSFVSESLASLDLRKKTGGTVITIIRDAESFPNPAADFVFQAHDRLFVLTTKAQQEAVSKLLAASLEPT